MKKYIRPSGATVEAEPMTRAEYDKATHRDPDPDKDGSDKGMYVVHLGGENPGEVSWFSKAIFEQSYALIGVASEKFTLTFSNDKHITQLSFDADKIHEFAEVISHVLKINGFHEFELTTTDRDGL